MQKIRIHEVGMRDGLQIESKTVPLDKKVEWIKMLINSGLRLIQAGSFVHPVKVPQMADSDALFERLKTESSIPGDVILSGLVLNERGLDRGLACGVDMFCMGTSASESHSLRNSGKPTDEALATILSMAERARENGKPVQLSVQCAFGYKSPGDVSREKVLDIVSAYVERGFKEISLADTSGLATPFVVKEIFHQLANSYPEVTWACHFHEARGYGLANCFAAIESGVTVIEASFGGLGGCPFTAKASGNVCTEDLAAMLLPELLQENIEVSRLAELSQQAEAFFEKELPGKFIKQLEDQR